MDYVMRALESVIVPIKAGNNAPALLKKNRFCNLVEIVWSSPLCMYIWQGNFCCSPCRSEMNVSTHTVRGVDPFPFTESRYFKKSTLLVPEVKTMKIRRIKKTQFPFCLALWKSPTWYWTYKVCLREGGWPHTRCSQNNLFWFQLQARGNGANNSFHISWSKMVQLHFHPFWLLWLGICTHWQWGGAFAASIQGYILDKQLH